MTTRDRYQNPILGDTIRLRDYVYTSQAQAVVPLITKVELFKVGERLIDLEFNPQGLTLKQTIANHVINGTWDEIQPFPVGASYPDYYWTDVVTDSQTWTEGTYAEKWYMIFDETIKLEGYANFEMYQVKQSDLVADVGTASRKFIISPEIGRILTPSGIRAQAAVSDMTLQTVSDDLQHPTDPSDPAYLWPSPPVGLLDCASTTLVVRIGQGTTLDAEGRIVFTSCDGWVRCDTDDGVNWVTTIYDPSEVDGAVTSNLVKSAAVVSTFDADGAAFYSLNVEWTDDLPDDGSSCYCEVWCVDQWKIDGVEYDALHPNPWDDAWDRTDPQQRAISSHDFKVSSSVFFTSPRPAVYDFSFTAAQIRMRLGSRGYISCRVTPTVSVSDFEQYYRQFIQMGDATYKIWRVGADIYTDDKVVAQGIVNYREGQDLFVYIDATKDPFLTKGMYLIEYTIAWREIIAVSPQINWEIV